MRILLVGDVFGENGQKCVQRLVPRLRERLALDFVVVNGENAARGLGIYDKQVRQLLAHGADAITLGNHALRQKEVFPVLNDETIPIVRPANLQRLAPGRGMVFVDAIDAASGEEVEVAVLNLMGSLYLDVGQSAWEIVDDLVEQALRRTPILLVDMHAEATSEKVAIGIHLDGRATAVVGTHTHVQTSDARILPGGTAYVTDLGMSGPHGASSVIGVRSDIIIKRFQRGIGDRFVPATEGVQLEGVVVDLDAATGRATSIEAIRIPDEE
ncbi:MAG: metallophosphoesterase [Thermoleophilia bacterium]|jgi:metallophosphoesterase (TIGR00282 family)|nr:metallophosphoesterase [Thermoleophilia bacterium]